MHLSMLSPRVGGAYPSPPPSEIDIQGCPLGRDFEHTTCPDNLTEFDSGFPKNVRSPWVCPLPPPWGLTLIGA